MTDYEYFSSSKFIVLTQPNRALGQQKVVATAFLLVLVMIGLTAANWQLAENSPGGNDFAPRWVGTRLLLFEGLNPYSPEASLKIQEFFYGRPAKPKEDQHLFVYPLYTVFIFAPFALIENYTLVRALWMTTLEISLVVMAIIGLKFTGRRFSPIILGGAAIFGLLWYHGMRPLVNGNPAIVSALFLTLGLFAIQERKDLLAGAVLALATIKPQLVILVLPLILFWSISQKRWRVLVGFIGAFITLLIAALIIEPGWISQNFEQVQYYPDYTLAGRPRDVFTAWWPGAGPYMATALSLATAGLLLWILFRSWKAPFTYLVWAAFCTLAITDLIGIQTAVSNYVAFLPALIFIFVFLAERKEQIDLRFFLGFISLTLIGLWALFLATREGRGQSGLMFFPVPLFVITTFLIFAPKKTRKFEHSLS